MNNIDDKMPDYKINGWESEEAQFKRFHVLYKELKIGNKTLLDIGCGTGTLLKYLGDRRIKTSYVGIDTNEELISIAKDRLSHGVFLNQDIMDFNPFPEESFDVVFASGLLMKKSDNNENEVKNWLVLFNELSARYIVFNCLSTKANKQKEGKYYMDPISIPFLIKKSPLRNAKYKMVEGYLGNDFTVIIEKEPNKDYL